MSSLAFPSDRLTPEIVKDLWRIMGQRYGSRLLDKSDSSEMVLVADFLDVLQVMDRDVFLQRYTTTIMDEIYTPFEIGVVSEHFSLARQVRICVHEHKHVSQFRDGGARFMFRYLANSHDRARYEMHALQCSMEMHWALTGSTGDPLVWAEGLRAYNCNDGDIAYVAKALEQSAKTIRHGGIVNKETRDALTILLGA